MCLPASELSEHEGIDEMLQQLRNPYWMKWGMWVILGLTIPSFVLFYGFSGNPGAGSPVATGPLVTVRDGSRKVELGPQELLAARRAAAAYYTAVAATSVNDPNQLWGLRREVEEGLKQTPRLYADFAVGDVALNRRLDNLHIRVTDSQVSEYLRNQGVTAENLRQQFPGQSNYEIAASVRAQLRAEAAERTVNGMARTSLLELWQEYLLREERLTASYARISVDPDPALEITEEQLRAKYDELVAAGRPSVREPERRIYEYVILRAPVTALPSPTDEQMLAAYMEAPDDDPELAARPGISVRQLLIPPTVERNRQEARAAAAAARTRIEGGENFADVANEVSLDLRNLQFVDVDTSPTFLGGLVFHTEAAPLEAAWGREYADFVRQSEPGVLSDVLATPQGYVIARVEERVVAGKRPVEAVRQVLRERVRRSMAANQTAERERLSAENLARLRAARRAETRLEGIARAVDATVQTTSPTLSTSSFILGVGNLTRDADMLRRMRPERISDPLTTEAGDIVVLRIKEVIPPSNIPLDQIRPRIEQLVRTDVAAAAALAKAEQLRDVLLANPNDSLTSRAIELDLQAATIDSFTRESIPAEFRSALDADTVLISARKGDVLILRGGTAEQPFEYIVVRIEKVTEPDKVQFFANLQSLEQQLLAAKRQAYLEEFRRDAVASLQPEYNPDFIGQDRPRRN